MVLAVKEIALDITARHPGDAVVFAAVWLLIGMAGVLAQRRGVLVVLSQRPDDTGPTIDTTQEQA
jgi:hypothetical protein